MNKWLPIGLFAACFAAIAAVTLYLAPSWGLMDDYGWVVMAHDMKISPLASAHVLMENFSPCGMFRPFYAIWAAVFYGLFEHWPTGFYIFVAAWNMTAMALWGMVFYHLFEVRREDYYWTVFFYPLTFFMFTPFWNIFNYLSLQEKFVVLFAPLTIFLFQKLYKDFRRSDAAWMGLLIFLGLMSKATFVFIPFIFLVYAVLDLAVFRYRPRLSLALAGINGAVFAGYAVFTFAAQLKGGYTARYKESLAGGSFLVKILHLPLVVKALVILAVIGFVAVCAYAVVKKKPELSPAVLIYLGLMAYIGLLLPWGFQSYLLSALGPLVLGTVFPVYAWLNRKEGLVKFAVNATVVLCLIFVFIGNIAPSIARMADIRGMIDHLRQTSDGTYLIPPGYMETADATRKFTGKKVIYCKDGVITAGLLAPAGNYVVFSDLFSTVRLSGVAVEKEVFANGTWKIFTLVPKPGHDETMSVPFEKTFLQKLKIKIRGM
jgi:hypothetical protein